MKPFAVAGLAYIGTVQGAKVSEHEQTVFKSFNDVISKFEFDWEVHPVQTEDGY